MKNDVLKIIPLGGLGEVGRNMMVYEYDEQLLLVDCGLMFPESDMLGIDYIIPDFQYLRSRKDKIRGIVFTHGHEDHIGAIHHLMAEMQPTIYATPLTMGFIENKLAKKGLQKKITKRVVKAGEHFETGPFKVDLFHVCHSIPDSVGLGIETPAGLIVQSGDYKFDHTPVDNWPTDYAKLVEFSQRGVMALIADSTNATRSGWTPSERMVDQAFVQVFSQAKGRIIVASFASLVSRMAQVANAAIAHKRKIAFVGTSMLENVEIAERLGYLKIAKEHVVTINQALNMPDEEVVIMCTGAQGEPTSILGRLSMGSQKQFDIKSGDTVVLSSKTIPGNEEAVYRTINGLFRLGANVIYEEIAPVHVSGHGSQEDIKLLIQLTKPKYFIPAYGELRHLHQSALLAMQTGLPQNHIAVIENGQVLTFKKGKIRLGEHVSSSYVFVDGSRVGDVGPEEMRDRESLSRDGVVMVHLNLDLKTNQLRGRPAINSRGFASTQGAEEILSEVVRTVVETVKRSNGNLENDIIRAVSGYIFKETHRRPTILVTFSRI
jgi:ribonuclease J